MAGSMCVEMQNILVCIFASRVISRQAAQSARTALERALTVDGEILLAVRSNIHSIISIRLFFLCGELLLTHARKGSGSTNLIGLS
jgi:hypothetical protein